MSLPLPCKQPSYSSPFDNNERNVRAISTSTLELNTIFTEILEHRAHRKQKQSPANEKYCMAIGVVDAHFQRDEKYTNGYILISAKL